MTLIEILTTGDAGRPAFHLRGANMSYVVAVTRHGHLETVHFGASLGALASVSDLDGVRTKTSAVIQGTAYTPEDPSYCLDYLPLDWSGLGKGDYRGPATEFSHTDGTFVSDFRYRTH